MVRGFYTLASGLLTQQRTFDTISNNVANVKTPGYKKQTLTSKTFDQELVARIEAGGNKIIGKGSLIRWADTLNTDYSQSDLLDTGIPFDVAIVGDGFFRLEAEGMDKPVLTRNGQFTVDAEGYLSLPSGGRVLGEGGAIQVDGSNFTIDEEGYVFVGDDDSAIDRISVAYPASTDNLTIYAEGIYVNNNPEDVSVDEGVHTTSFLQGKLENSNVDISAEMTKLMEASRSFQSLSQAVKIVDKINSRAVTEIGKV